jgi:tetratricopeptide (TPR) repeat protein
MNSIKTTILGIMMFAMPFLASAQSLTEAKDAYKKASEIISYNKEGALELLEKALGICKALGAEGDTTRLAIEGFMPGLYFELANAQYKDKDYQDAIPKFKKAAEIADLYKDALYKQRSTRLLANCYLNLGNNAVKNNQLDSAIYYFQTSFDIEAKGSKWFSIAQIYLKKGNEDQMTSALDKSLELAKAENDTATISKASKLGRQYNYSQASTLQAKNGPKAIDYLNKTVFYDPKYADAYYMKTLLTYKMKRWQESAEAANAAIANETDPNELPKIYFKLGWIYVYLQKAPEACAAFRQASKSKDYADEAKLNMRNLKCN